MLQNFSSTADLCVTQKLSSGSVWSGSGLPSSLSGSVTEWGLGVGPLNVLALFRSVFGLVCAAIEFTLKHKQGNVIRSLSKSNSSEHLHWAVLLLWSHLEQLNSDAGEHELQQSRDDHDVSDRPDGDKHTLDHMLQHTQTHRHTQGVVRSLNAVDQVSSKNISY